MNILTTATAAVALVSALGGSLWVGMSELRAVEQRAEAKFVPLTEWQDFQWTQLKRELRDIEKDMAEAEFAGNVEYAEDLAEQYAELVEFICRKYPDDREC